jgi:hypothetical protein
MCFSSVRFLYMNVLAGITTGQIAEDFEPRYHVFSTLIVSPQAMLVAPDNDSISTPYGLANSSSQHLFDALNAAIADIQRDDIDETLFTKYNRSDIVRAYTCRQDTQLPVVNRNETNGYLHDILFNTRKLKIGGLGPFNWGLHDGDYTSNESIGIYPELLRFIVQRLGQLKGPDGIAYADRITIERTYYENDARLFRALLDGEIHATDVYLLVDAPYRGTSQTCTVHSECRARESCSAKLCTHPPRPRSLHFRTTCTVASRDSKFITKKNSRIYPNVSRLKYHVRQMTYIMNILRAADTQEKSRCLLISLIDHCLF